MTQDSEKSDERDTTDPDLDATVGAPRWVKVSALVVLALIVLVVVVLLVVGGKHGPGRHTLSAPSGGETSTTVGGSTS